MYKPPSPRKALFQTLINALLFCGLVLQPGPDPAAALPEAPLAGSTIDSSVQILIEEPALEPTFGTCESTYWLSYINSRGYFTFVTLNVSTPSTSTNAGTWRPNLPQDGFYRVEAFIAEHPTVNWCNPIKVVDQDTSDARYEVHHSYGVSIRTASQHPLADEWLDLGVYAFEAGTNGYVSLPDLSGEVDLSTTISYSAMRFTLVAGTSIFMPVISLTRPIPTGEEIQVMQAQGFDLCHPPTVTQMSNWWKNSPYRIFGLYLGGAMFSKDCEKVDAAWLRQVRSIGWTFIPTWVGPQAPCTTYYVKFSYNAIEAYTQGRQEADLAIAAARSMGLLPATDSKTILYYDLEGYYKSPTDPLEAPCRAAAKSFLNGWSKRLHELGFKSGSYGSSCSSYLRDWALIANPLDDIWAANWYRSSYDPNASVFDVTCVDNTLWPNHQRIRQYTAPHDETWGSVRLHIDSDVADGEVAAPNIALLSHTVTVPLAEPTHYIQDFQFVDSNQGWLLSDSRLYWTEDGGQTWQKLLDRHVTAASFLDAANAWILAESSGKGIPLALYRLQDDLPTPADQTAWETIPFPLPTGDWQVIQMEFRSPEEGWIVLRQATNSAIQQGLLMQTHDHGDSWEDLPISPAEAVYFTSENEAWMSWGEDSAKLYQFTLDAFGRLHQQRVEKSQLDVLEIAVDGFHQSIGTRSWQLSRALPSDVFDGLLTAPIRTHFINPSTGWALVQDGNCAGDKGTLVFNCTQHTSFWRTTDQGASWQEIEIPNR